MSQIVPVEVLESDTGVGRAPRLGAGLTHRLTQIAKDVGFYASQAAAGYGMLRLMWSCKKSNIYKALVGNNASLLLF